MDLVKYQDSNNLYYPSVTIRDIAVNKFPTLKVIAKEKNRNVLKAIVDLTINQYVDETLLPLSPIHLKMVVEWITSEYDPRTKLGGVLGYTIEDIHLVFRMGLRGDFGKPIGHKYILTDITAEGGWFDQYHTLRGKDHAEYHEQRNKSLMDVKTEIGEKDIPCPDEYKIDPSKIGRGKKLSAVYNSPKLGKISENEIEKIVNEVLTNKK